MADLLALAAQGLPPTGSGIYLRDSVEAGRSVSPAFVAVNGARRDAPEQAAAFGGAWLYSTPEHWTPQSWRDGLAALLQLRETMLATGVPVHGIVANPERGWGDLSAQGRRHEVTAMGQQLRELAAEMRVGLSSVPRWPGREDVIAAAGDAIWYSPQLYGRTSQDPERIASWWRLWTEPAGEVHCIPSIAGWVPEGSPLHGTAQGYRDYLAMLPAAAGSIAWLGTGPVPSHIEAALRDYQPGGSLLGSVALAARNALLRPAAIAVGVALVVLVALLAVGLRVMK